MPTEFAIVDLFAGPGGLAEGFSSIRNKDGSQPFQIELSVEKEAAAFETLRFRSFFRQFKGAPPADYYRFLNGEIPEPDWKSLFPVEWSRACGNSRRCGRTLWHAESTRGRSMKRNRGCLSSKILQPKD
jgi:DNA (cytosine-5)-methyltransferase 1